MKKASDISAGQCVKAIRASFPEREYALLEQVANGVGWSSRRWADVVAFGLWPSRGLMVHGFEIKVSRQDWKRELKDPAKSGEVQKYCDHWWIVTPEGLVEKDELPPTWGLFEVSASGKGKATVKAPTLVAEPVTRSFVAAIIRRHAEAFDNLVRRERTEATEEGAMNGHGELARRLEQAESKAATLLERIEEFERIAGVRLDSWNYGDIAKTVKLLTNGAARVAAVDALRRDAKAYERCQKQIAEEIAALEISKDPHEEDSPA